MNIHPYTEEFLQRVKIVERVSEIHPTTVSGQQYLKQIVEHIKTRKLNLGTVQSIIKTSATLSNDSAFKAFHEQLVDGITEERVKFHLASVIEYLSASSNGNPITEGMITKIDGLLMLEETEVRTKLANGFLDKYQANPNLGFAIQECKNEILNTDTYKEISEFHVSTPISFVEKINEETYVRVANSLFVLTESGISPAKTAPSQNFINMSSIVEHASLGMKDDKFTFENVAGKFVVDGSTIMDEAGEEVLTEAFVKKSSRLIESKLGMENADKQRFVSECDQMIAVVENSDNIMRLDNVTVVRNIRTNETLIFAHHNKNRFYTGVVASAKRMKQFTEHECVSEAIGAFATLTHGYDITEQFKDELVSEKSIVSENLIKIQEITEVIKSIDEKIEEIDENKAIVEQGSEAYNKLDSARKIAVGLRVEHNNLRSELINTKK